MSVIPSNIAWAQLGKQASKGTLASTFDFRTRLATDDRLVPRGEFVQFAETDGSRDAPDSEKLQGGFEGGFGMGLRDAFFHKVAEAALGFKATTGTTNYSHAVSTKNGAADVPLSYYSIQQNLGDQLWEQFVDGVVNEWTVTGEAGGFLTSTLTFMGITPSRLTSAPTGPAVASGSLYNFNDATISIGGAAVGYVRSFNMTVSNNLQLLQTDDFTPRDVHAGQREVTIGFDMLFENLDHYNAFHYGGVSGTAQSGTTYITDLLFSFSKGANNGIDFDFDSVNFEEVPVAPDTAGDPIIVAARARTRRNASGPVKCIVKNQVAT